MTQALEALRKEGKISRVEYDTYITFYGNDMARNYLAKMVEAVFMEEPISPKEDIFAWHDGRRSVWRDIKLMLNNVEKLLGEQHDSRGE